MFGRNEEETVGGPELRALRRTLVISALTWLALTLMASVLSATGVLAAPFSLVLSSLGIGMGFAVATARMLGDFRVALVRRQARLRALSVRLMSVQEEERRRLSREIHDGLSQSLTAVASYLWLIDQQLPEERETLRRLTGDARRLLAQTLGEMRELSQRLCPPLLELYGLVPSIEAHVKAFEERHKIATRLDATGFPARLPVNVETALYRITQEALTNVARHARAQRVRVRWHGPDRHRSHRHRRAGARAGRHPRDLLRRGDPPPHPPARGGRGDARRRGRGGAGGGAGHALRNVPCRGTGSSAGRLMGVLT